MVGPGMRRRRGPGGLVAVAVAAVGVLAVAAAVVARGGDSGGLLAEARTPTSTVEIIDLSRLPDGERVPPDIEQPQAWAGLVILPDITRLPEGREPRVCPPPTPAGRTAVDVDVQASRDYELFQRHALYLAPPAPDGWELASVRVESVEWDDGTRTDSLFAATYEAQSAGSRLTVTRSVIEAGCTPEVLNRGAGLVNAYTLGDAGSQEVLFFHREPEVSEDPTMNALWVSGNIFTIVSASGAPLDIVTAFVAAFVN